MRKVIVANPPNIPPKIKYALNLVFAWFCIIFNNLFSAFYMDSCDIITK